MGGGGMGDGSDMGGMGGGCKRPSFDTGPDSARLKPARQATGSHYGYDIPVDPERAPPETSTEGHALRSCAVQ